MGRAWERGYTWVQFTEITQLLLEFFVVKDHLTDGVLFLDVGFFSCGQEAMYANALLEALHTSCDQARRAGDSLAVTEAMYANAKPYILRATKRGARVTVVR